VDVKYLIGDLKSIEVFDGWLYLESYVVTSNHYMGIKFKVFPDTKSPQLLNGKRLKPIWRDWV